MNNFHKLSLLTLIVGFVFFSIGVLTGEVEVGFFLFFPFLIGSGFISFLGLILVFFSIFLFIYGFVNTNLEFANKQFEVDSEPKTNKKLKGGGIVLIGPIPIVFGTNLKITIMIIIITLIILLFIFLNCSYF